MHGGHDPDNVTAPGESSRLSQSKPRPPQKHFGSILPMIKGSNEVDLNGVRLDEQQLNEIGTYITETDNIKSVTLRNSGMDDAEFMIIARSLQQTKSSPTILNFSLNRLTVNSMVELSSVLSSNTAVSVLILNGNPIGDQGCKRIVKSLTKTKDPFPFLRRSSGYITPAEAREQEITDMKEAESEKEGGANIKELYLGDCNLTDDGIAEISKFLEINTSLESLNLSGNTSGITPSGWLNLGQALNKNKTLKTLSLDYTDLGDAGLENLAKGLRTNTGLRCLEMESAGLTERGGELLKELLKSNTTILEVTAMPGNNISDGMMEEIRKYLALNNTAANN